MDEAELQWMVTNRILEKASVRLPEGETTPKSEPHECVVFGINLLLVFAYPMKILLKKF
jgi:hypothetical protein